MLVDYIKAMCKTGVHAVVLDTLFASQCIMSKKMWMEIEGPFAKTAGRHHSGMRMHGHGPQLRQWGLFRCQMETMKPVAISFAYPPDDCKDMAELKPK